MNSHSFIFATIQIHLQVKKYGFPFMSLLCFNNRQVNCSPLETPRKMLPVELWSLIAAFIPNGLPIIHLAQTNTHFYKFFNESFFQTRCAPFAALLGTYKQFYYRHFVAQKCWTQIFPTDTYAHDKVTVKCIFVGPQQCGKTTIKLAWQTALPMLNQAMPSMFTHAEMKTAHPHIALCLVCVLFYQMLFIEWLVWKIWIF